MIVWHLARSGGVRGAPVVWARVCDGVLNREYPRGCDYLMCRSGRVCDIGSRFLSRTLAHASRRNVRCARIRDETIDRGDTIAAEERVRQDKISSLYIAPSRSYISRA